MTIFVENAKLGSIPILYISKYRFQISDAEKKLRLQHYLYLMGDTESAKFGRYGHIISLVCINIFGKMI